jgi:phosphodiesterase/alkaline phosphatase D-like protein
MDRTPTSSGPDLLLWLKRALLNSRATWKVIASDRPLSRIVYDDATNKKGSEAFAKAMARRTGANWKSPISCASSRRRASPTRYG